MASDLLRPALWVLAQHNCPMLKVDQTSNLQLETGTLLGPLIPNDIDGLLKAQTTVAGC